MNETRVFFTRVLSIAIALVMLTVALPPSMPTSGASKSGDPFLVYASNELEFSLIQETAVEVVHDYGSFVLALLTPDQEERLVSSGLDVRCYDQVYRIRMEVCSFDVRVGPQLPVGLSAADAQGAVERYYLVQFVGPVLNGWLDEVRGAGAEVFDYIPFNAYVVRMDRATLEAVSTLDTVQYVGPFHPAYKLSPNLDGRSGIVNAEIVVYVDDDVQGVIDSIESLGGVAHHSFPQGGYLYLGYHLDAAHLPEIALLNAVRWVETFADRPGLDDELSGEIVGGALAGYGSLVNDRGYDGTGVVVSVCDSGIDVGDELASMHLDLRGRIDAVVDYTGTTGGIDEHDHGTHCAGIVGGNGTIGTTDGDGYLYGVGVAPNVHLINQNGIASGAPWPPAEGWQSLARDAVLNGADVMSNSWWDGDGTGAGYTANAALWDGYVRDANVNTPDAYEPLIIVFSAGNSGSSSYTITSPKEAKNIITVGASENDRPAQGSYSDNMDSIASFSSRGPAVDERIKPDISAPGTYISSTLSTDGTDGLWGEIDSDYVWCSGTSQACPHVAGGSALFVEYYRDVSGGFSPSPALTKAALINGAVDMDNSGGTGYIPNNDEGWGRMYLPHVIAPDFDVRYEDQQVTFTSPGEFFEYAYYVADNSVPLKVSLAWSDAPGASGANPALVNDLDLLVTAPDGSTTYVGNGFTNGWSDSSISTYDDLNNVENVYIQTPVVGTYTVRVSATAIGGSGVPDSPGNDQDFALVVSGLIDSVPTVTVTYPASSEEVASGGITITWLASDDTPLPGGCMDIEYSGDGGATWSPVGSGMDNTGYHVWDTAAAGIPDSVNCRFRVSVHDSIGQLATALSPQTFSIDNTPNDIWYLQVESVNLAGHLDMDMKPVETSLQEASLDVPGVGELPVGSYASEYVASGDVELAGEWRFSAYARVTSPLADGLLYAEVMADDGATSRELFTTGRDDESIGTHSSLTDFNWTYAVPSGTVLHAGEHVVVRLMLNATSGAASIPHDWSAGADIPLSGTVWNDHTFTYSSDDSYEVIIERSGGGPETEFLNESFGSGIPGTWTVVDGGENGGAAATWTTDNPGERSPISPITTPFAIVDSDEAGTTATQDEQLITPSLDLSGTEIVTLDFDQYFYYYSSGGDEYGDVDVRSSKTSGSWVNVFRNHGASSPNPDHQGIDISAQAADATDVQVRFYYYNGDYDWYWMVDNVVVSGAISTSLAEHKWTVDVPSGEAPYEFHVEANRTDNPDGDDFTFAYSTDNVSFTDMVTISSSSEGSQSYSLPAGLSGTVYIRVRDTDRAPGNMDTASLNIDHMYISSVGGPPRLVLALDHVTAPSSVEPQLAPVVVYDYNVALSDGWNSLSFPVKGSFDVASVVENTTGGDVLALQYYDSSTGAWMHWSKAKEDAGLGYMNSFTSIDQRRGLLLLFDDTGPGGDGAVLFRGGSLSLTPDRTITLQPGWSLVGYPTDTNRTVAASFGALWPSGKVLAVEDRDGTRLVDTDTMHRGEAYWVYLDSTVAELWECPV